MIIPYVDLEDIYAVLRLVSGAEDEAAEARLLAAKVSAARCARVSYLTHDGKRDVRADIDLFNKLVSAMPAHWSPLEHVATPWAANRQNSMPQFVGIHGHAEQVVTDHLPRVGNLVGWRSLRTEYEVWMKQTTFC